MTRVYHCVAQRNTPSPAQMEDDINAIGDCTNLRDLILKVESSLKDTFYQQNEVCMERIEKGTALQREAIRIMKHVQTEVSKAKTSQRGSGASDKRGSTSSLNWSRWLATGVDPSGNLLNPRRAQGRRRSEDTELTETVAVSEPCTSSPGGRENTWCDAALSLGGSPREKGCTASAPSPLDPTKVLVPESTFCSVLPGAPVEITECFEAPPVPTALDGCVTHSGEVCEDVDSDDEELKEREPVKRRPNVVVIDEQNTESFEYTACEEKTTGQTRVAPSIIGQLAKRNHTLRVAPSRTTFFKQQSPLARLKATSKNPIFLLVTTVWFDLFSALLIISNTASIGIETDWMARNPYVVDNPDFGTIRLLFAIAFTIELILRIAAGPKRFVTDPEDRLWNGFDTAMVLSSLFEMLFHYVDTGGATSTSRVIRILRVVRIVRAMRIGRILRYARTFRQIAYSLQASMGTLFWALLMVFLILYCFAICFCQVSTDQVAMAAEMSAKGYSQPEHITRLQQNFSSVPMGLLQLFMSMSGGRNWGEVLEPLLETSTAYTVVFLAFISSVFFGVLNIVTAIFVDSAMQSQQHYKDLLIQEKSLKNQMFTEHLTQVFAQIDTDGSGSITGDEMDYFLQDPALNSYLEAIDVFPNDARALFCLLDVDDSGEVNIDEFCQGCLRLKGEAKSFDIHCLIYNVEKLYARISHMVSHIDSMT
eukprot:TRINITY_DN5037_c0_g1_i1.p1 TRINITY_DN5037_c0_g1~~TRINITY_DN5037_c0_g1_i1.p1  ORF type:complete len:706 (+),score=102.34 TRINITY_DN5037_c0_g1_i1:23-2140(+)